MLSLPRGRFTAALVFCGCLTYCTLFFSWIVRHLKYDQGQSPGVDYAWRGSAPLVNAGKYRIVLCAKVSEESPYLLEWIEFHRIQGVDKFVLYHDAVPRDTHTVVTGFELQWLPILYRQVETRRRKKRGQNVQTNDDVVDVLPVSLLVPDLWESMQNLSHATLMSHRSLQSILMEDCVERYKDRTDYILHIDIDEFVYAPKYPSVYAYLTEKQHAKSVWTRFSRSRPYGIYIPSLNFGSSGTIWDFHNGWVPDATSGTVHTYFDPRDSTLLQFLRSANLSQLDDRELFEKLPQALEGYRLQRLRDTDKIPVENEDSFFEFLKHMLTMSQQQNQPPSPNAFLELLLENEQLVPAFEQDTYKAYAAILQEAFAFIRSPSSIDKGLSLHEIAATASTGTTTNFRLKVRSDMSEDRLARVALYNRELTRAVLSYPLVIEEQLLRGPDIKTSKLDQAATAHKAIMKRLPLCGSSTAERRELLLRSGCSQDVLERELRVLESLCKASIPSTLTLAGKVIYFTTAMHRSEASRRSGRLRGCLRPWVHDCSHWVGGSSLYFANARDELRIDHHQFRSFEKRSFGLPQWRGGPMGYPQKYNYTLLQMFLTSIRDTGKLRFVPELRQRLLDFHPLPRQPKYDLVRDLLTGTYRIRQDTVFRRCTAIELLGEHQVMCPKDFPFVGLQMVARPLPHPYLPYGYCSDIPPNIKEGWLDFFHVTSSEDSQKSQNSDDKAAFDQHVVLCPGYGETRCCDYAEHLAYLSSQNFPTGDRIWAHPVNTLLGIVANP